MSAFMKKSYTHKIIEGTPTLAKRPRKGDAPDEEASSSASSSSSDATNASSEISSGGQRRRGRIIYIVVSETDRHTTLIAAYGTLELATTRVRTLTENQPRGRLRRQIGFSIQEMRLQESASDEDSD